MHLSLLPKRLEKVEQFKLLVGGRYNGFPLGDIFQRNVNIRSGQAPVIHYMPYMFELVSTGKIDPSDVVSHVLPLSEAKRGYEIFDRRTDNCIKVVLKT